MIGSTLSHYRIDAELGRGGMGIVYRAQDTKLNREVAVKVLPSAALATEDDRARFYREAQAAAQLHHPNIATIFEIDEAVPSDAPHGTQPSPFIAMEFIEGDTLDARIKQGPMKLEEALRIASQIAGALEAAHEKEIVHRDVKSANVMLTKKGVAKVLDFGLAKTSQSTKLTRMGSTVGTVAYMSPEQARGEEVDRRTDVWALGVVLYEMCSGQNPFGGDYEQAVVYSILNEDPPPLTGIRTGFPMGLEWIIGKCLAKRADDRYQRVEDLLVDLRTVDVTQTSGMSRISSTGLSSSPVNPVSKTNVKFYNRSVPLFVLILAFALGALLFSMLGGMRTTEQLEKVQRFTVTLNDNAFSWWPSLSDDGQEVIYRGTDLDLENNAFYIHDFETGTTEMLYEGNSESWSPRISPNGQRIAVHNLSSVSWMDLESKVPIQIRDSEIQSGLIYWLDDDSILYPSGGSRRIYSISTDTIQPYVGSEYLDELGAFPEHTVPKGAIYPIPDHRSALTLAEDSTTGGTHLMYIKDGRVTELVRDVIGVKYSEDGFITFTRQSGTNNSSGRLLSQLFDPASGKLSGSPSIVTEENVQTWLYSVNPQGTIWISSMGSHNTSSTDRLLFVNPQSGISEEIVTDQKLDRPAVSPDGSMVLHAGWNMEKSTRDVELTNFETGLTIPLVFGANKPEWHPGADRIYYVKTTNIYEYGIDQSSPAVFVTTSTTGRFSIHGDGNTLIVTREVDEKRHLFAVSISTGEEHSVGPTDSRIEDPVFSPDSRFVAAIKEIGGDDRAVIFEYPSGSYVLVSDEDARFPEWSPAGDRLYYYSDKAIRAVDLNIGTAVQPVGRPYTVFEHVDLGSSFDVMPDGQLAVLLGPRGGYENETAQVIMNWGDHLRSLLEDSE